MDFRLAFLNLFRKQTIDFDKHDERDEEARHSNKNNGKKRAKEKRTLDIAPETTDPPPQKKK